MLFTVLFVCFFLLPCDLVCATTRNPGYTNWVLHLWLASCWQTRHTLVFASMFLTTTTLEAEECRNYTGCCQPQQVGITSSFFFLSEGSSHSYIFKSLSEMQEIKNRGFLVNSHCCCLSSDVFVHIDTYTAETGVSRFLQLNKNWRLVFYFDLKSLHQSFFFFFKYTVLNFLFFCGCFELSLEFRKKFGLTSVFSICIVSFSCFFFQIL